MKTLFWTLWQLPQVILGWIVIIALRAKKVTYHAGIPVYKTTNKVISGGGLGMMIFLNETYFMTRASEVTVAHEYGHCRQSRILGWLYLIVVGIPSLSNNIRSRFDKKVQKTYYTRYPEKWADKLGNVKRF
jgi:uncharacterized protein YjaZ